MVLDQREACEQQTPYLFLSLLAVERGGEEHVQPPIEHEDAAFWESDPEAEGLEDQPLPVAQRRE